MSLNSNIMNYTKFTVSSGTTAYLSDGETQILPAQGKHRNNSKIFRSHRITIKHRKNIQNLLMDQLLRFLSVVHQIHPHSTPLSSLEYFFSFPKKKKEVVNSRLNIKRYQILIISDFNFTKQKMS